MSNPTQTSRENCKALLYPGASFTGNWHDELWRDSDITLDKFSIAEVWKSMVIFGETLVVAWEHASQIQDCLPKNNGSAKSSSSSSGGSGNNWGRKRPFRGDYVTFQQPPTVMASGLGNLEAVIPTGMTRLQILPQDNFILAVEFVDETTAGEEMARQKVGKKRERPANGDAEEGVGETKKAVGRFHLELNRKMNKKAWDCVALRSNEPPDLLTLANRWHGGIFKLVGKVSPRTPCLKVPFAIMDMAHPGVDYRANPRGVRIHPENSALDFRLDERARAVGLYIGGQDWPRGLICQSIRPCNFRVTVTDEIYENYQRNATGWEPVMEDKCVATEIEVQEEEGVEDDDEGEEDAEEKFDDESRGEEQGNDNTSAMDVAPNSKKRSLAEYLCGLDAGALPITVETNRGFLIDALLRSEVASPIVRQPWGRLDEEFREAMVAEQAEMLADGLIAHALRADANQA